MLWIHGLNEVLLLQSRENIAVLPIVSALLLHYNAMDKWTDYSVGNAG